MRSEFDPVVKIQKGIELPGLTTEDCDSDNIDDFGELFVCHPSSLVITKAYLGKEEIVFKARLSELLIALGKAKAFIHRYSSAVDKLNDIVKNVTF